MKLFLVILKGFVILWVPLTFVLVAVLGLVMAFRTALVTGGIAGTLIAGVVTYLVVESKAKEIRRAHPEFRRQPPGLPERDDDE